MPTTRPRSARPEPDGPLRPPVLIPIATHAPLAASELLGFLTHRVIDGVEAVVHTATGPGYARSLAATHGDAVVVIDAAADDQITASVVLADDRDLDEVTVRIRRICDADADPVAVDAVLGRDPTMAAMVQRRPGLRVPGTVDTVELAVRALIGQQVSLAGAAVTASKISRQYGSPVHLAHPDAPTISHHFPTASQLAAADAETLPMPRARGRALVGLAAAFEHGEIDPDGDWTRVREQLLALKGIGPWTADYVGMRAYGATDVLLTTDLAVKRELERLGRPDDTAWAPYRSYATMHLWHGYLAPA